MATVGNDYTFQANVSDPVGVDNAGVAGTYPEGHLPCYAMDRLLMDTQ